MKRNCSDLTVHIFFFLFCIYKGRGGREWIHIVEILISTKIKVENCEKPLTVMILDNIGTREEKEKQPSRTEKKTEYHEELYSLVKKI